MAISIVKKPSSTCVEECNIEGGGCFSNAGIQGLLFKVEWHKPTLEGAEGEIFLGDS